MIIILYILLCYIIEIMIIKVKSVLHYYYIFIISLPFEGVGVKFIRIFKTNNCQLVYYKDVLELFQVVE